MAVKEDPGYGNEGRTVCLHSITKTSMTVKNYWKKVRDLTDFPEFFLKINN